MSMVFTLGLSLIDVQRFVSMTLIEIFDIP